MFSQAPVGTARLKLQLEISECWTSVDNGLTAGTAGRVDFEIHIRVTFRVERRRGVNLPAMPVCGKPHDVHSHMSVRIPKAVPARLEQPFQTVLRRTSSLLEAV